MDNCIFCQLTTGKAIAYTFLTKDGRQIPCTRVISEDTVSIAFLAPEQYTKGHTIVALKKHRTDITDTALLESELDMLIYTVKKTSALLKDKLHAERIYVATLCDGVHHLHFHLIPRYAGDKTGFEFVGNLERDFLTSEFYLKPDEERVRILEAITDDIKGKTVPIINNGYTTEFKNRFVQEMGMPVKNFRNFI